MPSASTATTIEQRLKNLAGNLWWTWNHPAVALLTNIDPQLFAATNQNPLRMFRLLGAKRIAALGGDPDFLHRLHAVEKNLSAYLAAPTWYRKIAPKNARNLKVAYFCAEFAVHESLPQYSGGLGVLAGDHVKSASDLGLPFVGVGLLYRRGYYTQKFAPDGATRVIYPELDFSQLPIADTGIVIQVPMGKREIAAKIWRQTVGRINLFLLATDIPQSKPADRRLTHHLYGGDRQYRIQQEILLGVGGMIALDAVGQSPTVVHMNEGHAAFAALERVARLTRSGAQLPDAIRRVSASSVFTTHTPVPAGNDRFDPKLALKYIGHYARDLGVGTQALLALGREDPTNRREEFCMTVLALRLSQHCNGVSALHGQVSRQMWKKVYIAKSETRVPIGHVTNGIHVQTWLAPEMLPVYDKYLKPNWIHPTDRLGFFSHSGRIPDEELWSIHAILKRKLVSFVRQRLNRFDILRDDVLTIGFARRFATYKRAPLIFQDRARLAKILGNPDRPVQILFAGKAHPKDTDGQLFAKQIHRFAELPAFKGRVVLIEDYDMNVARYLVAGCDVWLNNPLRPQEASGTSGMKPPLHGGLNCSILDGWWPECFDHKNGWAIGDGSQLSNLRKQDRQDAQRIYDLLEKQIIPRYYHRDSRADLPRRWIAMMKHSMSTVGSTFNTHRMVGQYLREFYLPAHRAGG
ncbi:MAG: alpha-glucan family phosphorylase [Tepidisphaeraceae bacterium]|jgi:starch phosphorylase